MLRSAFRNASQSNRNDTGMCSHHWMRCYRQHMCHYSNMDLWYSLLLLFRSRCQESRVDICMCTSLGQCWSRFHRCDTACDLCRSSGPDCRIIHPTPLCRCIPTSHYRSHEHILDTLHTRHNSVPCIRFCICWWTKMKQRKTKIINIMKTSSSFISSSVQDENCSRQIFNTYMHSLGLRQCPFFRLQSTEQRARNG